ncbi:MAG: succinylglutamate desuccinylase/aspartoacylase family protein [Candidatus Gracilibacteria bacterium]|nr:succinylglutamate desuccinylase/aspartoacylase family protein [Candidatus Gracilibacteria bacterium]
MKNIIKKENGIYEIDSGIQGPIISIIGGIHGNEKSGVYVLDLLKKNLNISKGKIYLIYGNLKAIKLDKRQLDFNLNRMFVFDKKYKDTYEYKRAKIIKNYLDLSDVSLDLHSSPSQNSPVFVICEKNSLDIIKDFPIKNICFGFDNIEPGGTDYYMNSIGKIGICVECGTHNDILTTLNVFNVTINLLSYYGMINCDNKILGNIKKEYFIAKNSYITKTDNFKLEKKMNDFEIIKKGQLIGYDGKFKIYSKNTGKILFARDRKQIGVEGFIEIKRTYMKK